MYLGTFIFYLSSKCKCIWTRILQYYTSKTDNLLKPITLLTFFNRNFNKCFKFMSDFPLQHYVINLNNLIIIIIIVTQQDMYWIKLFKCIYLKFIENLIMYLVTSQLVQIKKLYRYFLIFFLTFYLDILERVS